MVCTAFRLSLAFWISLGLVSWAAEGAGTGKATKPAIGQSGTVAESSPRVRWKAADNRTWHWYECETLINSEWTLTGITTPVHKLTGQFYSGATGYLELSAVPAELRRRSRIAEFENDPNESDQPGIADPIRKAREGRPASKWLRSLNAKELREWLPTIDVPEAGVEGMTYWEHLTRDHGFDPAKIEGLSEEYQAKLHAAAHAGY